MKIAITILLVLFFLAGSARAEDDPLLPAKELFRLRDHDAAEAWLLDRLAAQRDDVEAMKLLGEVYIRTERPKLALTLLDRAVRLAPRDPAATAGLWEARLATLGWTAEGREIIREMVDAFHAATPAEGATWRLEAAFLGYQLLNARDKKAELRELILARTPDDPPEVLEGDLLEAVIVEKRLEPRIALIRQFLRLFPESKQANYMREIWIYMVREDRARLFADATAMLREYPDNRRVRAAFGRWLLESEPADPARALHQMKRAVALLEDPLEIDRPEMMTDDQWHQLLIETRGKYGAYLGRAHQMLGRNDAAIDTLEAAGRILSHHVALYLALGDAYAAVGRFEDAKKAWRRSCESGPSPDALSRLTDGADESFLQVETSPGPHFADVTEKAGLAGAGGSRIAAGDVNGDGWPDLVFHGRKLFLNDGYGRFTNAPMPEIKGARGGLLADLDNDGDLDLYVFRTAHPMVLANDGKGVFTDRTPDAMKLDGNFYTEAAAVLDFDGDGLLDLYMANYERPPTPPWARGTPDILWRNRGDFQFEDVSDRLKGISAEPTCGRGCATADFDDDGDTDLFVANYRLDPDKLFVNDGKGSLDNQARFRGVEGDCDEGWFGHGIGPVWGDLNGDGHLDLVVPNLAHPRYIGFSDVTRVFLNQGPLHPSTVVPRPEHGFVDFFESSGIRYEETHSNASLADVDLDGDLDLFLTSVYKGRWSFLYLNDGKGKFTDATWRTGTRIDNGWGSIFIDHDLDGDPDLIVRTSQGMKLFENKQVAAPFFGLTLVGRDGNGSAIGARATLSGEGWRQVREIGGGSGTGCQDDPSLRFGVREKKGPYRLLIRWPGGRVQRIEGVKADGIYRLVEGGNLEKVR